MSTPECDDAVELFCAGERATGAAPGFVPVTIVQEAAEGSVSNGPIEIVIGSISVRLIGAIDAAALRQVLEVVRSLA